MSHIEIVEVHRYYPNGIERIIGRGGENYIGVIDESTVLKYPCIPGITSNLKSYSLPNDFNRNLLGEAERTFW